MSGGGRCNKEKAKVRKQGMTGTGWLCDWWTRDTARSTVGGGDHGAQSTQDLVAIVRTSAPKLNDMGTH